VQAIHLDAIRVGDVDCIGEPKENIGFATMLRQSSWRLQEQKQGPSWSHQLPSERSFGLC
jgi:hypothetical protein